MDSIYVKIGQAIPFLAMAAFIIWAIVMTMKKTKKTGAGDEERIGAALDGAPFVLPKTRGNVRANHVPPEQQVYQWGNQMDVVLPNRTIKAKNNL